MLDNVIKIKNVKPSVDVGKGVDADEIRTINLEPNDRYVVSFVVGYSNKRVATPQEACAAALSMTLDRKSDDTIWFVYDRRTGDMKFFAQDQFQDIMYEKGYIK